MTTANAPVARNAEQQRKRRQLALGVLSGALALGLFVGTCQRRSNDARGWYGTYLRDGKSVDQLLQLTDHNGAAFDLTSQRGKIVLLAFGFTHCPDICPATLTHLAAIRHALPNGLREQTHTVFVTLDPTRDTPDVLKNYVPAFDPHAIGLTGTSDEIAHGEGIRSLLREAVSARQRTGGVLHA